MENEQEKAFQKLKDILSAEPLLIYLDFSQPIIVACDASNTAIGAVLSQLRDGEEKPIAYCSRQTVRKEITVAPSESY
jgi:hypothetical protein